jgi:hypothetical protein
MKILLLFLSVTPGTTSCFWRPPVLCSAATCPKKIFLTCPTSADKARLGNYMFTIHIKRPVDKYLAIHWVSYFTTQNSFTNIKTCFSTHLAQLRSGKSKGNNRFLLKSCRSCHNRTIQTLHKKLSLKSLLKMGPSNVIRFLVLLTISIYSIQAAHAQHYPITGVHTGIYFSGARPARRNILDMQNDAPTW